MVSLLLAVVACKKEAPATQPASAGSAGSAASAASDAATRVAVSADAAAAPSKVELLHAVPATLRVSSQVHNRNILPRHIADGDMQTAWNSITGELVGAWVDVTVETGSKIAEIRLTVGHTGRGKRGEDYFTMNPRITKVKLLVDGKPEAAVVLDPEKRDLQAIAVDAGEHVRLVVAEIKPGSKKRWREAAISEIEAWGTPPAGWPPAKEPRDPIVIVGDDPYIDPCADLAARMEQWEERSKASVAGCESIEDPDERSRCGIDGPGPPSCSDEPVKVDKLAAPWKAVGVKHDVYDSIYGPSQATLTVTTVGGDVVVVEDTQLEWGNETLEAEAEVVDVIAGSAPELVLRYKAGHSADTVVVVCRADPALACSTPIRVAGEDWSADIAFRRGKADVSAGSGTAPPEALGEKTLVFP
jgi:hypothetical protein